MRKFDLDWIRNQDKNRFYYLLLNDINTTIPVVKCSDEDNVFYSFTEDKLYFDSDIVSSKRVVDLVDSEDDFELTFHDSNFGFLMEVEKHNKLSNELKHFFIGVRNHIIEYGYIDSSNTSANSKIIPFKRHYNKYFNINKEKS